MAMISSWRDFICTTRLANAFDKIRSRDLTASVLSSPFSDADADADADAD
eukprot:CAMPEP_0194109310 /NCGR_PEP_ID=MMETSP0150-20130528/8831_1 /TAXON_ID=122233 /ORGANISM="Chaetoceros debilis, Strain MM31A-1" /LENGTH=49 /DNA_ID= /DNA_START= /DNA_END= /DNA_ORIENTATION=